MIEGLNWLNNCILLTNFEIKTTRFILLSLPTLINRWMIWVLGVTFEVRGKENINKNHGGVVLMNHQSLIDMSGKPTFFCVCDLDFTLDCWIEKFWFFFTVCSHLWPLVGRATTVVKRSILYIFPLGPAAYLWGTLFIDRSNHKKALNKLNHEVIEIQENNAKLLIFPEGTRSQKDYLLPFKKGAFHIAIQSQSTIQPVVVSKYWFIDSDRKWFGRGNKNWILNQLNHFIQLCLHFQGDVLLKFCRRFHASAWQQKIYQISLKKLIN